MGKLRQLFKTEEQFKTWLQAVWGIFIICLIQLFLEYNFISHGWFLWMMVLANFIISAWIMRSLVIHEKIEDKSIWIGAAVSFLVFMTRLLILLMYRMFSSTSFMKAIDF